MVCLIGGMVCLVAAPLVLKSVSAGNGWLHNALQYSTISSCQSAATSALLFLSLTHVSSAVASVQTFNLLTTSHRGPKRKLRADVACVAYFCKFLFAGTWRLLVSAITTLLCCEEYFSSSSVVSRAFSALCVYSKFRHHPHLLGYLCAKFRFFRDLHC